jgi:SAM-dependent methyltransferase
VSPHLRSGIGLLDTGCGVGSIALELAEMIAPGDVSGLDRDPAQLELARAAATARELRYIGLQAGNVYELPSADTALDVALAHTLLFQLGAPLRANTCGVSWRQEGSSRFPTTTPAHGSWPQKTRSDAAASPNWGHG